MWNKFFKVSPGNSNNYFKSQMKHKKQKVSHLALRRQRHSVCFIQSSRLDMDAAWDPVSKREMTIFTILNTRQWINWHPRDGLSQRVAWRKYPGATERVHTRQSGWISEAGRDGGQQGKSCSSKVLRGSSLRGICSSAECSQVFYQGLPHKECE